MFPEIMIIIMAICMIATASIGVECYNSNKDFENNSTRKNNKNFLIVMIVFGILAMAGGIALLVNESRTKGAANAIANKATANALAKAAVKAANN
jgi:flagellar basal body-associated protein FliL